MIPRIVFWSLALWLIMFPAIGRPTPVISEKLELETVQEYSCYGDRARVEVYGGDPVDWFDAKRVVVTFTSYTGEESRLTFLAGSFGIHCPQHPLGWKGFFVFQIACPSKDFPRDPTTQCDFKNNYGIVFNAQVLMVPHPRNGKLAAELFNVDPKIKTPLAPVPTLFNVNGMSR